MEPVTLDTFKAHARVAGNSEDDLLALNLQAAREVVEQETGVDYVSKVKTNSYPANKDCPIPTADILSVSGFYSDLTELATAYDYWNDYVKGITVNRDYPISWENMPTYQVTYQVTIDPATVPATIKRVILMLAADFYENREASTDASNKSLAVSYKTLLAPYRKINNI